MENNTQQGWEPEEKNVSSIPFEGQPIVSTDTSTSEDDGLFPEDKEEEEDALEDDEEVEESGLEDDDVEEGSLEDEEVEEPGKEDEAGDDM